MSLEAADLCESTAEPKSATEVSAEFKAVLERQRGGHIEHRQHYGHELGTETGSTVGQGSTIAYVPAAAAVLAVGHEEPRAPGQEGEFEQHGRVPRGGRPRPGAALRWRRPCCPNLQQNNERFLFKPGHEPDWAKDAHIFHPSAANGAWDAKPIANEFEQSQHAESESSTC